MNIYINPNLSTALVRPVSDGLDKPQTTRTQQARSKAMTRIVFLPLQVQVTTDSE